jgi:serine/threonine-protein kinase
MDAERWHEISRLFHEALDRRGDARGIFLDNACRGDKALRAEVESLLVNEATADAFLRARPIAMTGAQSHPAVSETRDRPRAGGTLGSYRIERQLGRGGMGTVFLAYDTRLHRRVALKVIEVPADSEASGRRLLCEARNAAALNHPNICTIHEVGRADGTTFIAMEYVEGRSLRERLDEGGLSQANVLSYGIQAADALAHAHDHAVVHRDFKAANAVVTEEGRLKIVDFGLATRGDVMIAGATLVPAGAAAGTPYTMAPEQVRVESIDSRTDIWALGVLLYEMASGTKPFVAPTISELFSLILRDPPAPLSETLQIELRTIIERCLDKERERRYQHAGEVRELLEAIQAGAAPARPVARSRLGRRLAVLPIRNLSGDPEQEYFADGIHEALITDLAQIAALRVIARPSVMRYQQSDTSLREIARDLKVDMVLTGSVSRQGDRARVTAQLLDAATDEHLWAGRYERGLRDVLSLPTDIVTAVAREIQLEVTPLERARLGRARPVNPQAYEAYLKAKFELNKFTGEGFEKALALFHEAIAIDPAEPLAYAGLARGYTLMEIFSAAPSPDDVRRAKAAALKAVELDDTLAEAHTALAFFKIGKEWDYAGAEQSFRRALDLNPNLPEAHMHYGQYLAVFGSPAEAIAEMKRGIEVDPLSPLYIAWLGGLYWELGRLEEAIAEAQKAMDLQPDFPVALFVLGITRADQGQFQEAIAAHEKALAKYPGGIFSWVLARTYALAGRLADARGILAGLESGAVLGAARHPWFIAAAYVAVGDHDEAMVWLEKAYDARIGFLVNLQRDRAAGATFRPLHTHPRFQALLRRLNLTA